MTGIASQHLLLHYAVLIVRDKHKAILLDPYKLPPGRHVITQAVAALLGVVEMQPLSVTTQHPGPRGARLFTPMFGYALLAAGLDSASNCNSTR